MAQKNDSRKLTYDLHKLAFIMDRKSDDVLQEKVGITLTVFKILMALSTSQKECLSSTMCQSDIAKFWDMTEAAVSRQIENLIDQKLVERTLVEENKKKYAIILTPLGKNKLEESIKEIDLAFDKLYRLLDDHERSVMISSLDKLLSGFCSGKKGI